LNPVEIGVTDVQFNMVAQEAEAIEDFVAQQRGAALMRRWTVT